VQKVRALRCCMLRADPGDFWNLGGWAGNTLCGNYRGAERCTFFPHSFLSMSVSFSSNFCLCLLHSLLCSSTRVPFMSFPLSSVLRLLFLEPGGTVADGVATNVSLFRIYRVAATLYIAQGLLVWSCLVMSREPDTGVMDTALRG
jgi:hypothetical protein